ncbi:unnamed protein product [Effrenium voratum]|nr:unnamed protein product [Effrenium voratum]
MRRASDDSGGLEAAKEASPQSVVSTAGDQSSRLLEQMRACVLVHHQLSCLLIHSAALQAGLYDGEADKGHALRSSIQSLGGSTARLFCMALRDQKDLHSMGETLGSRVDEMVEGLQAELCLDDEDVSALAECSQLENQLAACRKEAKQLRAKLTGEDRDHRRTVFEQAARVHSLEQRREALDHAMDDLLAAGLSAEAARGPAAQAARNLLGRERPESHGPLQRQLHQHQLERPAPAPGHRAPVRMQAAPVVRSTGTAMIATPGLVPVQGVAGVPVPRVREAERASLAQLDAQLRASQTDFWGM